jgi:hypothetical protein
MAEELDEFGIPIKRQKPQVDEFGIPLKKKDQPISTGFGIGLETSQPPKSTVPSPLIGQGVVDFQERERKAQEAAQKLSDKLNTNLATYYVAQGEKQTEDMLKGQAQSTYNQLQAVIQKDVENKGGRSGYLYNKLLQGTGAAISGGIDAGLNLMKYAQPMNPLINDATIIDYRASIAPEIKNFLKDQIGAEVDKGAERKYDEEFITSAVGGLAYSVPAMVTPMGVGLYTQAYDSGLDLINSTTAGKNLTEAEKTLFAATLGTVMGRLEKTGLDRIVGRSIAPQIARNTSFKALKELAEKGVKITPSAIESIAKREANTIKNRLLNTGDQTYKAILDEFTTGGLQELGTVGLEQAVNALKNKDIFETQSMGEMFGRVLKSAAQEGIGGGIMGAGKGALPINTQNYLVKEIANATSFDDVNRLLRDIESIGIENNYAPEEIDDVVSAVNNIVQTKEKLPPQLTVAQQQGIIPLILERDELSKELQKANNEIQKVDPAFVSDKQSEIAVIENQINAINKDIKDISENENYAVQEQAAGQIPVQPEARVGEEVAQGEPQAELEAPAEGIQEKITIGVAPFREINVTSLDQDTELRSTPEYKNYVKNILRVTKGLGLKVNQSSETWGGYVDTETGRAVQEVSNMLQIQATPEEARVLAAILGKTAPELQDSVLVGNFNENGTGAEHMIRTGSFDNATKAIEFLKKNGLEYFTIDKNTGDIIILDMDGSSADNIINFNKELNENGITTKHTAYPVEAEFVGRDDYDGILAEQGRRIAEERGIDIDAIVSSATKRFQKTRKQKVEPEAEVEVEIPQVIEEDATDLASKIRKLKVDLGKGALQSNIAGLPIAVYNSVVEFVATSVEAGMTIKQAIERAIEKYNLNKFESFDKDQMIKEIEVKNNPVYFDNIKKFASDSSFDNKIQFKSAIQNINKDYLPQLKSIYGKNFNPSELSDSTKKYLTDILTVEAFDAIRKHPEAIGWYDEKTTQALDTVSLIHPEIKTDPESRGAFILALAIMSNGNKVDANFDLAEKQYSYFKKNGKFETEGGFGIQQSGIKKSLEMINSILDAGLSMTDLNEFLTSKYRAGDLKVKIDGKIKNLSSGELANELVYGAVILGPKIGNGFYMNLWGKFDQLTMDRWFMRTWGRLTGTLIESNKEKAAKAKTKFLDSLSFVKKDKDSLSLLEGLIGKVSQLSPLDLAKAVKKVSMDKVKREKLSLNPLTDQLRRASNNLLNILDGEKEAPSNGAERKFIRDVFDSVQKRLKENYGIDITMADLQAVMWYPEKILYESFKSGESFDTAAEGYTSDEAPDYFNAAKKLAIKKGIDENKINKTITVRKRDTGGILGDGNKEIGSSVSITDQELAQRIKGAISGEKIADSVRSLKINVAKGALQSNIAGLPIALYNSVIEFIATSIEAGDTVAQAIKKAIDKFKLRDIKSFNENELKSIIFEATGEETGIIKRPAGKLSRVKEGIASIFRRKPKGEVGRALKPEEFTEFEEVSDNEQAVRDLRRSIETPFRNKEKLDKTSKSIVSRIIKAAFDSQVDVVKRLLDKGGDVGKIAVAALKNRKGYNGKASIIFRQFSNEIFDDLGYTPNIEYVDRKLSERDAFDVFLNLKRIINIDARIADKFARLVQVERQLKDKSISKEKAKELSIEKENLVDYLEKRKALTMKDGEFAPKQYLHSGNRTAATANAELKLMQSINPELYKKLDKAYDSYTDAFRFLLKEQYDNNLISKAVYDELFSYNYIPTKYIQHFIESELSQDNPALASKLSSSIKNLTGGSDSDVITNFQAILELYTNSVYKRIYENRASNSLARAIFATGEQERGLMKTNQLVRNADADITKKPMYNVNLDMSVQEPVGEDKFGNPTYNDVPTGYDVIYFYRDNGKRERIVASKDFVDAWYDRAGLLSPKGEEYLSNISKWSGVNLFKSLITKNNPAFGIYQILQDAPQALIATQAYPDFILGSALLAKDYATISGDIAKFIKNDELTPLFKEAIDAGIFSDFLSTESDILQSQTLVNADGSTDYKTAAKLLKRKTSRALDNTLNSIAKFNEAIEYATRLAVYKRMKQNLIAKYTKENGGVEPSNQQMFDIKMLAAEQARNVVDFSRSGTVIKPLNKVFAYLNAGMQAFYSSARNLKNDPMRASILLTEIGVGAAAVMGMSLGAWGNDEERKKRLSAYMMLSKYQKSNYFNIYNPYTDDPEKAWIRIPKPQPFRGYINLIEQGYLHNVMGADINMEQAKEAFSNDIPLDVEWFGIPDMITRNPLVNGVVKYSLNKDVFRNQEVVRNAEKIEDWAEGVDDENVSKFYKKLGESTRGLLFMEEGISPKRAQALVQSLIGDPARNTTTAVLDKAGKSIFYLATGNMKEIENEFGGDFGDNMLKISGLKGRLFTKTPKLDAAFMDTLDEQRRESFTKRLLIRSEIEDIYENAGSPQEARKLADERLSELVKNGDIDPKYKKRVILAQEKQSVLEGKPSWYKSLLYSESNDEKVQILEHYAKDLSKEQWNEVGLFLLKNKIITPEVTREFAIKRSKK